MELHKYSLKDIPIIEVLTQQQKWSESEDLPFTYEVLGKKYGSEKLVYCKMRQLEKLGYLDYGVSLRTAWLTDKGKEFIKEYGTL